jgi:hypothetical protein
LGGRRQSAAGVLRWVPYNTIVNKGQRNKTRFDFGLNTYLGILGVLSENAALLSWLSKKRSGIQTFFSTTVHSFMPQFRIWKRYYEKRYKEKKWLRRLSKPPEYFGSGGRIRTCDLRVMSPTSYQTAPPRIKLSCKGVFLN